jgi:chemotaxis protein MotA
VDITPLLAIGLSIGMILVGNALEGGHIDSLLQMTAALIVFGGTIGAAWLGATPQETKALIKLTPRMFRPGTADRRKVMDDILKVTQTVRRDGMLAVENLLPTIGDDSLRKGLQMLVDGNSGDDVKRLLELDMELQEHHGAAAAKLWTDAGGYAPTVGILGAVLGLIHVMQNLSDPSKLGSGIAVAFVATVYGVGSANLLFLPIGARLKKIVQTEAEDRAMILAGLQAIVAGANTRQIADILSPFMPHDGKHGDDGGGGGAGGGDAKAAA